MFQQAIEKYGKGGRFLFAIRTTDSDRKHRRTNVAGEFKKLKSESETGMAAGASRPGHDGGRRWSLSQLIASLPLVVNSRGVLRKLSDLYLSTGSVELPEEDKVATEEEQDEYEPDGQPDEEDPTTVTYTPGCTLRYVWLGVERFYHKNKETEFRLPHCLDGASIKKPAFICIMNHLRTASKNLQGVLKSTKVHSDMVKDALGHPPEKDPEGPSMAVPTVYHRIRVPPYDFEKLYGKVADGGDKKRWLQVNQSIPKGHNAWPPSRLCLQFLSQVDP